MAKEVERREREERAERLVWARKRKGLSGPQAVHDEFGFNVNNYKAHESGRNGFGLADAQAYARAFGVSLAWLQHNIGQWNDEQPMVPIVGKAGAGPDGSVLFATGQGNFGEVPAPVDATPSTVALEVEGNSMHGLANDGWLIFYDDPVPPSEDHLGEPCVVWLADGERVLVKIPQPGRAPGLFNLESVNAPTLRDAVVEKMALVTDIKPRRSAQKFIRRNPDQKIIDVVEPR